MRQPQSGCALRLSTQGRSTSAELLHWVPSLHVPLRVSESPGSDASGLGAFATLGNLVRQSRNFCRALEKLSAEPYR